ncbi:MAG: YifB family Mg chelatase-like AAA ATPase [Candidatus Puniceispirillaceae bacterium]
MQSVIQTVSLRGVDVVPVSVQVHISNGLPAMAIVGLADKSVAESKERVRAALSSLGLASPAKRVAVNLAPADIIKEGAHFDLPIAMGILLAMGVLPADSLDGFVVLGELSLSAEINKVSGILPVALHASSIGAGLVCPHENGPEAAWAGQIDIAAPSRLSDLISHIKGVTRLPAPEQFLLTQNEDGPDMADIVGQETARQALEIAAAGGHHMLMIGPPGAGKSMLASRLPALLPPLTPEEALETTIIHSVANQLSASGLVSRRPYRDPHHSASMASLVGGGNKALPGEASLAHHGILFLDELAEFNRAALDGLRQPLETGEIIVARANHHIRYPARFQLIAAMNPCRCGYLCDAERACSKAPVCAQNYMARISGPMLDRFDITLEVEEVLPEQLLSSSASSPTAAIKSRIDAARQFASQRLNIKDAPLNVTMTAAELKAEIGSNPEITDLLNNEMKSQKLSARGLHKAVRVARTIADLNASPIISRLHMLEALSYRRFLTGRLHSG